LNTLLKFKYDGISYSVSPLDPFEYKPCQDCIMTLFKNDAELLVPFVNYYKKLGITDFYMFYNGKLAEINKYIEELADVTFIEWDFPYWVTQTDGVSKHCAQTTAINTFLYMSKKFAEHVYFIDLDEYIVSVPQHRVDYGIINSYWSSDESADLVNYADVNPYNAKMHYRCARDKAYINPKHILLMGVHYPWCFSATLKSQYFAELKHICNFTEKDRRSNISDIVLTPRGKTINEDTFICLFGTNVFKSTFSLN